MGKVPGDISERNSSMIGTSTSVQGTDVKELWSLEPLGIKDPVEIWSEVDRQLAAK